MTKLNNKSSQMITLEDVPFGICIQDFFRLPGINVLSRDKEYLKEYFAKPHFITINNKLIVIQMNPYYNMKTKELEIPNTFDQDILLAVQKLIYKKTLPVKETILLKVSDIVEEANKKKGGDTYKRVIQSLEKWVHVSYLTNFVLEFFEKIEKNTNIKQDEEYNKTKQKHKSSNASKVKSIRVHDFRFFDNITRDYKSKDNDLYLDVNNKSVVLLRLSDEFKTILNTKYIMYYDNEAYKKLTKPLSLRLYFILPPMFYGVYSYSKETTFWQKDYLSLCNYLGLKPLIKTRDKWKIFKPFREAEKELQEAGIVKKIDIIKSKHNGGYIIRFYMGENALKVYKYQKKYNPEDSVIDVEEIAAKDLIYNFYKKMQVNTEPSRTEINKAMNLIKEHGEDIAKKIVKYATEKILNEWNSSAENFAAVLKYKKRAIEEFKKEQEKEKRKTAEKLKEEQLKEHAEKKDKEIIEFAKEHISELTTGQKKEIQKNISFPKIKLKDIDVIEKKFRSKTEITGATEKIILGEIYKILKK